MRDYSSHSIFRLAIVPWDVEDIALWCKASGNGYVLVHGC